MVLRSLLIGLLAAAMVLTSGAMALARTAPDGRSVVICTGMGLSTVTLDAQGNEMAPAPICPDCLTQHLAALSAPGHWIRPLTLSRQGYSGLARTDARALGPQDPAARGPPADM